MGHAIATIPFIYAMVAAWDFAMRIPYTCVAGRGVQGTNRQERASQWHTEANDNCARYSTYLGGLGTGIGEGNEGVKCGRGDQCLSGKEVEEEIDSDGLESDHVRRDFDEVSGANRHKNNTGYMTQEIEGIGGVVKKKVKKRVRVGAVVKEYEDEREDGHYLGREQKGINRSWCSWCCKVIPSQKDLANPVIDLAKMLSESSGSSSSVNSQAEQS